MSTQHQNCPNHRTVQRSFLNQICEDCLLAELESAAHHPENELTTQGLPSSTSGNGEGLIWDSEVKIEIESVVAGSPTNPVLPDIHQHAQNCTEEDDKRVFESHVEITIEADDRTFSATDICSPAFATSQRSHHSHTSPTGTSPPSTCYGRALQTSSPRCEIKNNGLDFSGELSEFEDADDEIDDRVSTYAYKARHTARGRPLTRSNLRNVQKCELDVGIPQEALGMNNAGKVRPRFQSLRSLSTTFLSGVKSEVAENAQQSPICQKTTFASSKPQSKNPFRSIRGRKSSPLLRGAGFPVPASSPVLISGTTVSEVTNTEAREQRPVQPQKSTLKDFALFLMQDFKRTPTTRSPSDSQSSGMARSATTIWSRSGINDQKGLQKDAENDSLSETVFESDSRVTSLQSEGSLSVKADEVLSAFSTIPSIPKSSTMNTLRAVISDLTAELDERDTSAKTSSSPTCDRSLAHRRTGDHAQLGQVAMPEIYMPRERVQDHEYVHIVG